jgi:hypothetical protein
MRLIANPSDTVQRVLLLCGVLSPLLRVATDVIAGRLWRGYNFTSRSISDLSAIGAPTRSLVIPLEIMSLVLSILFAIGIWLFARDNTLLRITAAMLIASGVFSLIGTFFPVQLAEGMTTSANKTNTIIIGISVLFLVLAMAFGAAAFKGWFRIFSIGLFVVFLVEDVWATWGKPFTLGGERGPLVGVQERTMLWGYLLWTAVLAVKLLRS